MRRLLQGRAIPACCFLALLSFAAFFFVGIGNANAYIVERRLVTGAAVLLVGIAAAVSSVLFQTLTHNRILTPSVVGFDSLYLLIEAVVIFLAGAGAAGAASRPLFLLEVALMVLFSEMLYKLLFRREGNYLYFILLAGVILGLFFRSVFSFFLVLIDPNEFDILQEKMFASFTAVQGDLLALAAVLVLLALSYACAHLREYDVFLLGRENAHNLGIDCAALERRTMRVIAVLVAAATALIGPVTFLGLMVVNLCYALLDTRRHREVGALAILLSWTMLFFGTVVCERMLTFSANLTVVLNGIGGIYFLYLILRRP